MRIVQIQQWGCHFLCLHYYIETFKKIQFNIGDINNNCYKFIWLGYMKNNCYILNSCSILQSFGINTSML
ncbi:DUF261 family protein (plasmid) [Borrelia hermsii DAH]|nr:DUF261 family protein [Borrelia hermsii]UPA08351.1 DUF261 family protein [Borrelia hermsii DAH]